MFKGVFVLLVGIILLISSGYSAYRNIYFFSQSEKAEGVIVSISTHLGPKGGTVYIPTVKFNTEDGQEINYTPLINGSPSFRIGDPQTVYYNPQNPEDAKINTFTQSWTLTFFLAFFGVLFFISGTYLIKLMRWLEK